MSRVLIEKFFGLNEAQKRSFLEKLFSEQPVLNRGQLWMNLYFSDGVPVRAATPGLAAVATLAAGSTDPPSSSTADRTPAGRAPLQE